MRLPLFGCIAVIGVAIGFVFLMLLYGYFRVKYMLESQNVKVPEKARRVGLEPDKEPVLGIPFEVPDGYVVRTVVRRLPCGQEQRYFIVMPVLDPCRQ